MPNTLEDFNIVGDGDVLNVTCMICKATIVSVEDGDSLDAIVEVTTEHEHRTITPRRAIDLAMFAIATLTNPGASSKADLESLEADADLALSILAMLRDDFDAGRQLPHLEWSVGDDDPTRATDGDDGICQTRHNGGVVCTWPRHKHPEVHVAGDGETVLAVWPVSDESPIGRS